jgi:phenylacetate-CoA ligase
MNRLQDYSLTLKGIWKYSRFLKRSQSFSNDEIITNQSKWLSRLFIHAHKNIPWYSALFREHGIDVNSVNPLQELKKIPILTKEQVRAHHADFCISGVAKRSVKFSTSGTTGEPLTAYTSFNQWIIEQGIIWRHWKSAGYNFRDRIAIFRSYSPMEGDPLLKVDRLRNWTYFSVFDMNDDAINSYVKYLQKWKPKFLRGYPSALNLIAEHALRNGWTLPSLKGAFSASEVVPDTLRKNLNDAFGIELFDHYGQAEITCMFHECEDHSGMHVNWEYGIVELLATAEKGVFKIIATNLHNLSMPLIRYDTGDLAVGNWESCNCIRSSLKIKAIRGRQDDYLYMSDQSRASPVNLYTYFSKLDEIQQFQLIQEKFGELTVLLRLNGVTTDQKWSDISCRVIQDLTSKTHLAIRCPRHFNFLQSSEGKFQTFVQRIKNAN